MVAHRRFGPGTGRIGPTGADPVGADPVVPAAHDGKGVEWAACLIESGVSLMVKSAAAIRRP